MMKKDGNTPTVTMQFLMKYLNLKKLRRNFQEIF
tara:strand:- start:462 stop:563 length:102 start_codon:yes stop_codon:yes gene_type:complete